MIVIDGKEVRINRANVAISEIDEVYINLCKLILDTGVETENRTGVNTKAIAGWTHTFDISTYFPIPETKLTNASFLSQEIQWIHQVQSNKVSWLQEKGNTIWNEWVVDSDGIWREYMPVQKDEYGNKINGNIEIEVPLMRQVLNHKDVAEKGDIKRIYKRDDFGKTISVRPDKESLENFVKKHKVLPTIKRATYFGEKYAGTIGEQYGFINALYQQPQIVEYMLKNNPTDRRMMINLWQRAHFAKAVLPSCVFNILFTVIDGTLHATVIQRSADVPAGLPFNIAQYALLVNMFAKAAGLKVGTLTWTIMNAHIYVDQEEPIRQQIRRYEYMKEYEKLILTSTDETVERKYNNVKNKFELLNKKVFAGLSYLYSSSEQFKNKIGEYTKNADVLTTEIFDKIPMSKRYTILDIALKEYNLSLMENSKDYEEAFERKISFEHMLTRGNPKIELEDHKSIFDYSTEYAPKGDKYYEQNQTGNKELLLKDYHPTPFIAVPVAQ